MTNEQIIEIVETTVNNLENKSTVEVDFSDKRKKSQTIFGFHINMWGKLSANFFIHSKFFDTTGEFESDEDYEIDCHGSRTQSDMITMMFIANSIINAIKREIENEAKWWDKH